MEVVSLDGSIVEGHPDGTAALRGSGAQNLGKSRGGGLHASGPPKKPQG